VPDRTIRIRTPVMADDEVITCSFTDDEWQDLLDFVAAVNAVVRTRFIPLPPAIYHARDDFRSRIAEAFTLLVPRSCG